MKTKCSSCGHQWETESKMILVTCSSCGKKTRNNAVEIKQIKGAIK